MSAVIFELQRCSCSLHKPVVHKHHHDAGSHSSKRHEMCVCKEFCHLITTNQSIQFVHFTARCSKAKQSQDKCIQALWRRLSYLAVIITMINILEMSINNVDIFSADSIIISQALPRPDLPLRDLDWVQHFIDELCMAHLVATRAIE